MTKQIVLATCVLAAACAQPQQEEKTVRAFVSFKRALGDAEVVRAAAGTKVRAVFFQGGQFTGVHRHREPMAPAAAVQAARQSETEMTTKSLEMKDWRIDELVRTHGWTKIERDPELTTQLRDYMKVREQVLVRMDIIHSGKPFIYALDVEGPSSLIAALQTQTETAALQYGDLKDELAHRHAIQKLPHPTDTETMRRLGTMPFPELRAMVADAMTRKLPAKEERPQ